MAVAVCLLAAAASAQSIQRCESASGAISYSNEACPAGTKPVKSLPAATQPSAEAQEAARAKVKRDEAATRELDASRKQQQSQAAVQQATQQSDQRAADCAYMRAEIDSVRRMRNMLTNRPYYSLDDLEQMDKHSAKLTTEYQRVCG